MLTVHEQNFINYWQQKRNENKFNPLFFIKGLSGGLLIGLLVVITIISGWYKLADKEIETSLNPFVLCISLLLIALFIAVFYNSFKYEQNEQLYKELLIKKDKLLN